MTIKDQAAFTQFLDALLDTGGNLARAARALSINRVTAFRWLAQSEYTPEKFEFEYDGKIQAFHLHVKEIRTLARIARKYNTPEPEEPNVAASIGELVRGPNFQMRPPERIPVLTETPRRPPDKRAKAYAALHADDPKHLTVTEPTDADLLGEDLPPDTAGDPFADDVLEVTEPEPTPSPQSIAVSPRAAQAAAYRRKVEARVASGGAPMTDLESRLLVELEEPHAARAPGGPMPPPRVMPVVRYKNDDDRREGIGAGAVRPGGMRVQ